MCDELHGDMQEKIREKGAAALGWWMPEMAGIRGASAPKTVEDTSIEC